MPSHYQTLEVDPGASADDIKRAWRRACLRWHPDRNKDSAAPERFKQVQAAYAVLGDPHRRRVYDAARSSPAGGSGWRAGPEPFGASFNDLFDALFRTASTRTRPKASRPPAAGHTPNVRVSVPLATAWRGGQHEFVMPSVSGQRRVRWQVPPGTRHGSTYSISLPDDPEQRYLQVTVLVDVPARWSVSGDDVEGPLQVSAWRQILGGPVEWDTPAGRFSLNLPAGATGRLRLPGAGLATASASTGDLYAVITPDFSGVTAEQKKTVRRWLAKQSPAT